MISIQFSLHSSPPSCLAPTLVTLFQNSHVAPSLRCVHIHFFSLLMRKTLPCVPSSRDLFIFLFLCYLYFGTFPFHVVYFYLIPFVICNICVLKNVSRNINQIICLYLELAYWLYYFTSPLKASIFISLLPPSLSQRPQSLPIVPL